MKNFIQNIMDKQGISVSELNCIQRVMLARNMNTADLSKLASLSYATAQNIATGKTDVRKMQVERFLKIAHGLGMTAEELYCGTKPDEAAPTYADERQRRLNEDFASMDERGKEAAAAAVAGMAAACAQEESPGEEPPGSDSDSRRAG